MKLKSHVHGTLCFIASVLLAMAAAACVVPVVSGDYTEMAACPLMLTAIVIAIAGVGWWNADGNAAWRCTYAAIGLVTLAIIIHWASRL